MSNILAGSLAFSGFGDAPMKFYSPAGVDLGAPPSAPTTEGSCAGLLASLTTGNVVAMLGTGGSLPGGERYAIFDASTFTRTLPHPTPVGAGLLGIARDDAGRFYSQYWDWNPSHTAIGVWIGRFTTSGLPDQTWSIISNVFVETADSLAVNGAGTIAYYLASSSSTIKVWDLVNNVSLGTFTTETGYVILPNALIALSNGEVIAGWRKGGADGYLKRYSTAGALLATYSLAGAKSTPTCVTPGLTDASVWCGHYNDAVSTSSGVTIVEIRVSDGAVLHSFDPDNGSFEFDGPFCVVRVGVNVPNGPSPPKVGCTPQPTVSTPAKNAGCNTGGVGFVPTYVSASGVMPVGADPTDGERLTGKRALNIWAEVTHVNY